MDLSLRQSTVEYFFVILILRNMSLLKHDTFLLRSDKKYQT